MSEMSDTRHRASVQASERNVKMFRLTRPSGPRANPRTLD